MLKSKLTDESDAEVIITLASILSKFRGTNLVAFMSNKSDFLFSLINYSL